MSLCFNVEQASSWGLWCRTTTLHRHLETVSMLCQVKSFVQMFAQVFLSTHNLQHWPKGQTSVGEELWEEVQRVESLPLTPVIQGEQNRQKSAPSGWLKSCRCTSPVKKEKPILAWKCRGGYGGCNVTRLTAAMLYKSYSVQIFRDVRLVLPNRHLR